MRIYPIIAGVYITLIAIHLTDDPIDWSAVAISFAIALAMVSMWQWLRSTTRRQHETLRWLDEHRELISDTPQYFRDSPVPAEPLTIHTNLRDFRVVTSAIIITTMHHTGADVRSPFIRGAIASLWTLTFGWWGLPWGPIRTIQALFINLTGGDRTSVGKAMAAAAADLRMDEPN